ncbi:Lar family restriction alleviation protein [Methylomonas subterranea]|uniref:Lar family restriction alleviation protein n=1 Tax=Methylomonas subterranea TaxID=2952225 RepID=UPI0035324326
MKKLDATQLLPCPFCGAAVEVGEEIERIGRNRHRIVIRCSACPAAMELVFSQASHSNLVSMHRDMMVEKWNRRAGATT